ncbi:MAG: hypothetical protein ACKV1O_27415 [Saprospiraceae bacterium]
MNRTIAFYSMLAFAGFLCACQPDKTPGETVITRDTPIASRTLKAPPVNPYLTPVEGAFKDPAPQAPSPTVAILTKGYWVIEHYIHAQQFEPGKSNSYRWYKLNTDGSFTAGQWDEVKSKGSWQMAFGENNEPVVIIDSENDAEDAQWVVQIAGNEDDMAWTGIRATTYQGHFIKLISLMTMPTKKQFGLE